MPRRVVITGLGLICGVGNTAPEVWRQLLAGASFQEDLGADSLDVVELVMQFEEGFDIEIPDEDAEKIKTVKDAVEYIEKHEKSAKDAK